MKSQRVGHNFASEQQQIDNVIKLEFSLASFLSQRTQLDIHGVSSMAVLFVAVVLFLWKSPDLKNLHSNKESEAPKKNMAKACFPRISPTCLLIVNSISRV